MKNSESSTNKLENRMITPRAEDFSQWYLDVIRAADLAEHAPVKGCMTIKPAGFAIWEDIQRILDEKFKETGVENVYFPLLIPERFLKKEAEHVKGFAPEVAVVTHAGGKELEEPLIIRPTSETIICEALSRWIQSHRDLPLLINQWCNILRWELRPRLFLRTTEFLWQEGHTVHKTSQEADSRARLMLDVYKDFSENYLAIPVFAGIKPESEKFAGAVATYSIEAMTQDGKALQMGTSHNLGQNFSKVFDIKFMDEDNNLQYVWQTSWGVSTRTIGGLIMVHSDDKGLVLPPKIAPIQIVVIPIWSDENERGEVLKFAEEFVADFKKSGLERIKIDLSENRAGEKFFKWEKKGVPVRIEIGPKDIGNKSVVLVRRDTSEKESVALDKVEAAVKRILNDIQNNLFERASEFQKSRTKTVDDWGGFIEAIEKGNFVLAHWSGGHEVEEKIKKETAATIRCIPFEQREEKGKCVYSGKPSQRRVLFARAY